MIISRAVDGE